MPDSRLSLAIAAGDVTLPDGAIVVFGADAATDLSALPKDRTVLVQMFRPAFDALSAAGWTVVTEPPADCALGVVFLPRSKAAARDDIATAARLSAGPVVIDGQKRDGIEGILREVKTRGALSPPLSKFHGKLAVLAPGADLSDWRHPGMQEIGDGFVTAPGVFSEDRIDPGSALLADALPDQIGRRVADLGAGWGYLSRRLLDRDGIEEVHLIEADLRALDCARRNVADPRARFHWADATAFDAAGGFDAVVCNPPFHRGHLGDPGLGAGFITAAARLLAPRGVLWLVANRHLPYERVLAATFRSVGDVGGDRLYKLIRAEAPQRTKG